MEFLLDPSLWAGLLTLIVLEIVLGVDNLVFIAIIAKKLPERLVSRALYTGLALALVLRLGFLSVMAWLAGLTEPLFSVMGHAFSLRDLILLGGGLFLVYKATTELHERLEAPAPKEEKEEVRRAGPSFAAVIVQILLIDMVFSLDSIITAIGMVDNLGIMMTAVVVAMGIMILASRPLTEFVNAHRTVVILCLSFLLMIGFSLIADAFGVHVPKGYLYAAIGFSILIEFFNQVAQRNSEKALLRLPFRERTTMAIVNLMSGSGPEIELTDAEGRPEQKADRFASEERNMVEGVLTLADRSIKTIMTPRSDIAWINVRRGFGEIMRGVHDAPHSNFPVGDGSLDRLIGLAGAKDLVGLTPADGTEAIRGIAEKHRPLLVPETISIIRLMREIKKNHATLALVADEFGVIQGLVTVHDILEAIAGDFPEGGEHALVEPEGNGWTADGNADLLLIEQVCGADGLLKPGAGYATVAGLMLERLGRLPRRGEKIEEAGLVIEAEAVTKRSIERVKITRAQAFQA
jgi:CBS domain containing-hemolysin-like protein